MAEPEKFEQNKIDFSQSTGLVSCYSSSTLINISETIRSSLEKSIDDATNLTEDEKDGVKTRLWQICQSALQENISVNGDKWTGERRDTLDVSPVDSELKELLNGEIPRKVNHAMTELAQKRRTIPELASAVQSKRLKLRRKYLELVEYELPKAREQVVSEDGQLSNQQHCASLLGLMEKTPTTLAEANLLTALYETEITSRGLQDAGSRIKAGQAKHIGKSQTNKKHSDENHCQNLIKDLNSAVKCTNDSEPCEIRLRRRKDDKVT